MNIQNRVSTLRYTFMNGGTPFQFKPLQMTKEMGKPHGTTMMKIHADLTLKAIADGRKDVYIIDPEGTRLSREELKSALAGKLP